MNSFTLFFCRLQDFVPQSPFPILQPNPPVFWFKKTRKKGVSGWNLSPFQKCVDVPTAFVGMYSALILLPRPQQVIQKRMTVALQVMEPEKANVVGVWLFY